jgi:hypothetical protein
MLELIQGRAAISVFRQGFIDMDGRDKPAGRMKMRSVPPAGKPRNRARAHVKRLG